LQVRAAINLAYYTKYFEKLKFKDLSSQKKVKEHKLEVAVLEEKCQSKYVFVNKNL